MAKKSKRQIEHGKRQHQARLRHAVEYKKRREEESREKQRREEESCEKQCREEQCREGTSAQAPKFVNAPKVKVKAATPTPQPATPALVYSTTDEDLEAAMTLLSLRKGKAQPARNKLTRNNPVTPYADFEAAMILMNLSKADAKLAPKRSTPTSSTPTSSTPTSSTATNTGHAVPPVYPTSPWVSKRRQIHAAIFSTTVSIDLDQPTNPARELDLGIWTLPSGRPIGINGRDYGMEAVAMLLVHVADNYSGLVTQGVEAGVKLVSDHVRSRLFTQQAYKRLSSDCMRPVHSTMQWFMVEPEQMMGIRERHRQGWKMTLDWNDKKMTSKFVKIEPGVSPNPGQ